MTQQDTEAERLAKSLAFVPHRRGMSVERCERITDDAAAALRALAAERDALRDEAEFLLERLHEWSSDNLTDENCDDWFGHVDPSMERLSALTGEAKP